MLGDSEPQMGFYIVIIEQSMLRARNSLAPLLRTTVAPCPVCIVTITERRTNILSSFYGLESRSFIYSLRIGYSISSTLFYVDQKRVL